MPLVPIQTQSSLWVLLACFGLFLGGCGAPRDWDENYEPGQPAWVDGLQEALNPIDPGPVASPSEASSPPTQSLRGTPESLAARLSGPPAGPRRKAPAGGSSRGGNGTANGVESSPVVVNVYADGELGLDGLEAEVPEDAAPPPPLSALETLYRGDFGRDPSRRLNQFGYDYFLTSAVPKEMGPIAGDYIIGPGDEIIVTTSGSFYSHNELTVDRDGYVVVPDEGAVPVAGRRYDQLGAVFSEYLSRTHRDFQVEVSLGTLRSIQVHVVGHVARPGMLEASARSTALTALIYAGGPLKSGSLRNLTLKRVSGEVIRLDLYELLVAGDRSKDRVLADGDVIVVEPIGATVGVAGYVQRPAVYEFLPNITVSQAIELAGGLTPFSFTPSIQIERTANGRGRETIDVPLDQPGRTLGLQDGDLLLIGAVDDGRQPVVEILGEVARPGTYQHEPGLTIRDLLEQADGVTVRAHLAQALISRQIGDQSQVSILTDKTTQSTSRRVLVVDLEAVFAGDERANVALLPLDHIMIRSRAEALPQPIVTVLGAVQTPGTYELTGEMRVSDLIAVAGNLRAEAFFDEAELIRNVYDETSQQLEVRRHRIDLNKVLAGQPDSNPVLAHGDRVIVRSLAVSWVTVEISGAVKFPGTYVFPSSAKITELMAAAGGVLQSADMRSAKFTRASVRELQNERFRHLTETVRRRFEDRLEYMIRSASPQEAIAAQLSLDQTQEMLGRMTRYETEGRIVLPFRSEDFPSSPYNLTLEDGDHLFVPNIQQTVSVIGHVFTPGAFVAEAGLTVKSVVERSGGMTEYADKGKVYLIRGDGVVRAIHQKKGLEWRTKIHAGDVVMVPKEPLKRDLLMQLTDILHIVRSGAESGLLINHLRDSNLDVNWVARPNEIGGVNYGDVFIDD